MRAEYPLLSCVWELTLACPFSCRHCGSRGGRAREGELTAGECLDVAEQLAALGCRRVSLIGGEVFLAPHWEAVVRALTGRGVRVSVITNGFLFTPALVEGLRRSGVESVALSLDGLEATHDALRQPGSFRRVEEAARTLSAGGIPLSVITTLNRENLPELEGLYALLCRWPVEAWQLQACSPMGHAAAGVDWAFPFREALDFVEAHRRQAPFLLGVADNIGYYTPHEGYLRGDPEGRGAFTGCRAGLTALGIDSVGNVRGCESLYHPRFIEGNLRERSLRDIWEDPSAFAYNRAFRPELLTGPCAACPQGPVCAGGCRSYNFFVHGKLYQSPCCARTE